MTELEKGKQEANGASAVTVEPRIDELARAPLELGAEPHLLVTFLNKTLKDFGFIFGLTRQAGQCTLTVYHVTGPKV